MEKPANEEEDIIIKCSVEEMVKSFFKEYAIVWYGPNINSEENQIDIAKLEKLSQVFIFDDWKKASLFIKEAKTDFHVITSGTDGELFVQEIYSSQNVTAIYVFCKNKDENSVWANKYQKVSCVETNMGDVFNKIQRNLLEWYKEASSLKLDLPSFAPIFDDSDKSQMNHLHRYLKVILNFKNRLQAKNDFINLSNAIYLDNTNRASIAHFEKSYNEYNKESILQWYSQESFLRRVMNNCLRIATSDSIQYGRFLLKDMQTAIKDQYLIKSKNFSGLLYRASYLSEEEWTSLKANEGQEIEMHGFLSVSKKKNMALNFLDYDSLKSVFITFLVPTGPNIEEQGFAEMEEFSNYPQEKEVIFNVRSRFTVLETKESYSKDLPYRHLVLLYGAQSLRKFVAEQNPFQEVLIPKAEKTLCNHCQVPKNEMSGKFIFLPITDVQKEIYYCRQCIDKDDGPFLCVPITDIEEEPRIAKIKGCLLKSSHETVIPFFGYKCCKCQAKKREFYFTCTDCQKEKGRWCQDCFEDSSSCLQAKHNIILETNAFSFWHEAMSEFELSHLRLQDDLNPNDDDIFQQPEMYVKAHQYAKAIEYYNIYIKKHELKGQSSNLAACYENIGLIYDHQGESNQALEYLTKSLDIRKSVYGGDNHPDIATSYHNIGMTFSSQGEEKKALEYFLKSLDIRRSVYGGDKHPDIAFSYHNIGLIYQNQGEYNQAFEYLTKSLDIRKSVCGENHAHTANSYNDLGGFYASQGDFFQALENLLKSLEIKKSVYGGDNHPDIATSYHNIGLIYQNQKEYKKALENLLKSLDIKKSVYGGDNHPDIATSYHNIGLIYQNQKEYKEALEYLLKSLVIRKSFNGDNHPDIATSYSNIGLIYQNQKEYKKALEYFLKSLDIRKSVCGENHAHTANSYNDLGGFYASQEKFFQALEYFLKSLNIKKSLYGGDNHSEIAASYNNIGIMYLSQGKPFQALENLLKSLDIKKSVYGGDNHPDIATSYSNIGLIYQNQEEYKKALEYLLKSLVIRKSFDGDNHPDVATLSRSIADVYESLGEKSKALEYNKIALQIEISMFGENDPKVIALREKIQSTSNQSTSNWNIEQQHPQALSEKNNQFANPTEDKSELDYEGKFDSEDVLERAKLSQRTGFEWEKKNEFEKAIEYYQNSLDLFRSVFGEIHSEVFALHQNLASTYESLKEYQKAQEHLERAIDIRESVDVHNELDKANLYNNLAHLHENMGENNKAIECHNKVVAIRESVLGKNHLDNAASFDRLTDLYQKLGRLKEAFESKKRAVEIRKSNKEESFLPTDMMYLDNEVNPKITGENANSIRFKMQSVLIDKHYQNNNS